MIYIVTGVHAGTHYKANFHEASDYKLSSVLLQICMCFFFYFFFFSMNIIFTLII